jgi:hypothetical protein
MALTRVFKNSYFPGNNIFGDDTDNLTINDGIVSLNGAAKRSLTIRAGIDYVAQIAHAKPTQVTVGLAKGYSMPIYADDNEELFFSSKVPYRWDSISNISFRIFVAIAAAEDVGDKFKFQFSWENNIYGEPIKTTIKDVEIEQAILVDRNEQYDIYLMIFDIDYDAYGVGNEITSLNIINGRLRRIAAAEPQITGEVIILDWYMVYNVDKMFGISTV